MTAKFIFELFSLPSTVEPKDIIEVTNFHDGDYGKIFYNGTEIYYFEGESYYDKLQSNNIVKKLIALGVNIKTAKVVIYNFDLIKELTYGLPNFDADASQFSTYDKLLQDIELDIVPLKTLIVTEEARCKALYPNAAPAFINIHGLKV